MTLDLPYEDLGKIAFVAYEVYDQNRRKVKEIKLIKTLERVSFSCGKKGNGSFGINS